MGLKTLDEITREFNAEQENKNASINAGPKTTKIKTAKIKTIDEITREFQAEQKEKDRQENHKRQQVKKKGRGVFPVISDIIFYLVILIILVLVYMYIQNDEAPKSLMGYSDFIILTLKAHSGK